MIGSFLYSSRPRPDDVTVWLQRSGDASAARIILPATIERAIIAKNYPPPGPSMSIESALSYAVFLAIRTGTSMVIAGDRELWNSDWGYLTDLAQFPAAGLVAHSDQRAGD